MKAKRKKIWIDRFQTYLSMRLALYFVVYMITVWIWAVLDRSTAALIGDRLGQAANYWSVLSASFVMAVGLLFTYDVVRFSHRVVGPLYRFRKSLKAIVDGEEMDLMKLRKDDFLHELKDQFNEVLKVLEQRGAVTLKAGPVKEHHKEGVTSPS